MVRFSELLRFFACILKRHRIDPAPLFGVTEGLDGGGEDECKDYEAGAEDPRQLGQLVLVLVFISDGATFSREMPLENH